MNRLHGTVAALLALLLIACPREEPAPYVPPIAFATGQVRIETGTDTFRIRVELAEEEYQRAYGLMERTELAEDAGMLFLYPGEQPATAGFWMYRTRIPLDIAYLDADGTIVSIRRMEPCPGAEPRACPTYEPGAPYHAALEVNAGFFARRGVAVGDRVVLEERS